jgi:NDP-sugar pyrophosphorylase family protein
MAGSRREVHISAGGNGTRIRKFMQDVGYDPEYPKHLLPTRGNGTLLGEITMQAAEIGRPVVHTNGTNVNKIAESRSLHPDTLIVRERITEGPLGPLVRELRRKGGQVLACAGDFWAEFDWMDFKEFHDDHGLPVSILVSKSVPTQDGATFEIGDDGFVNSWKRVDNTRPEQVINIGAYIVDWTAAVSRILNSGMFVDTSGSRFYKEDSFNGAMIAEGLMSAYCPPGLAYNVNTSEVYDQLLANLATTGHCKRLSA